MSNKDLKDLKNIKMCLPTKLEEISPNVNTILSRTELIIKKYIETNIYKTKLSPSVKSDLDKAFIDVKNEIL